MKVYRIAEFSDEDIQIVQKMHYIVHGIDKYDLRDELDLTNWNSFSGNIDKMLKYMQNHKEKLKKDEDK